MRQCPTCQQYNPPVDHLCPQTITDLLAKVAELEGKMIDLDLEAAREDLALTKDRDHWKLKFREAQEEIGRMAEVIKEQSTRMLPVNRK